MATLLAEQPLIVTLMLGALAAGLIAGWMQTGQKSVGIGALVCLLLIPAAWVLASRWQTDREQIRELIYEVADAVEQNDHDTAVKVIGDADTKQRARKELQNWTFDLADVNKIRSIEVVAGSYPQTADVDMSVKVDVRQRGGTSGSFRVPRRLLLTLEKQGDDWLIVEYQHLPIVGTDRFSGGPAR